MSTTTARTKPNPFIITIIVLAVVIAALVTYYFLALAPHTIISIVPSGPNQPAPASPQPVVAPPAPTPSSTATVTPSPTPKPTATPSPATTSPTITSGQIIKISPEQLWTEFNADNTATLAKYGGKTVEITVTVDYVGGDGASWIGIRKFSDPGIRFIIPYDVTKQLTAGKTYKIQGIVLLEPLYTTNPFSIRIGSCSVVQ